MKQNFNIIICKPTTEEGMRELADRVADVHADFVIRTIRDLDCSAQRKESLVGSIARDASQ